VLDVTDDYARSLALYRVGDVLLVNPVRDGMNLVAKEVPILSERGCAVVLSTEAGVADEFGEDALLVNPFDVSAPRMPWTARCPCPARSVGRAPTGWPRCRCGCLRAPGLPPRCQPSTDRRDLIR
jgi:hypothetical protein